MDHVIKIGNDGLPFQTFNGKIYKLYPGEKYFSNGNARMHRKVWNSHYGMIPRRFDVHHIDENKWNNRIENLELKESGYHSSEHRKEYHKLNPSYSKRFQSKGTKAAKNWHQSPEGLAWHKERGGNGGYDPNRRYGEEKCLCCNITFLKKTVMQKFCNKKCKEKYYSIKRRKAGV